MFGQSSFNGLSRRLKPCNSDRVVSPRAFLRKPLVECLEDRRVLAALGPQFQVDPTQAFEESPPAIAVVIESGLADAAEDSWLEGKPYFVAAWQSWEEDGSGFGIRVGAFDAEGQPISESLPLNIAWLGNQQAPAIATDGQGNFMVAWQSEDQVDGDYDVVFRTGKLELVDDLLSMTIDAGETIVGQGTAPAVAMGRDGRAVLTWTSMSVLTGYDIQAAVVAAEGIETITVADQPGDQLNPSVATDQKGSFVVAWSGPSDSQATVFAAEETEEEEGVAIFGRVITLEETGSPALTQTFLVSATTYHDVTSPSAAMNHRGRIAVAWQVEGQQGSGSDIFMTVFDSTADALASVPLVAERVNDETRRPQRAPSVGLDKDGSALVAWQTQHEDGYSWAILGKHYQIKKTGKPGRPPEINTTNDFLVNETVKGPETLPSVAMLRSGQALVGWLGPEVPNHGHGVEEGEGGHEPAVFVRWTDYFPTQGPVKDYGVDGSELLLANYVSMEDNGTAAAMDDRGISLVAWESWQESADTSSNGIYAALVVPDSETPHRISLGLINGDTLGNQSAPDVAVGRSNDEGYTPFVIVWQSDHAVWSDSAGSDVGYGVYAMLGSFDEAGTPIETLIITVAETLGDEVAPAVAMDEQGNFVVVWQAPDDSGQGIYAQHFNAAGAALTQPPAQVNQQTYLDQVSPTVAMNQAGQYVIAWVSDHNVLNDPENDTEKSIFARWFAGQDTGQAEEFLVNDYTKDAQEHPDVAIDGSGNFIVVWQSINQEVPKIEEEPPVVPGVSWGVYARRYDVTLDSDEFTVSPRDSTEFLVNDTLERPQRFANVGMDYAGNFVIAWQTIGQDGSSWAVYAKDYLSLFDPQDVSSFMPTEFRVNSHTMGPQILPVVARSNLSDAMDGYAIFWSGQGPGHTEGVFGRLAFVAAYPEIVDVAAVDAVFRAPEDTLLGLSLDWLDEPSHRFGKRGNMVRTNARS